MIVRLRCGGYSDLVIIRPFAGSAVSAYGCGRFPDLCSQADRLHGATMATCPECEFDEIDTTDHEEGDELSCPECGKTLVLAGPDDVEIADEDDEDEDDDDLDDDEDDEEGEDVEEDEGIFDEEDEVDEQEDE
jgi:hypothetical protein